MKVAQYVEVTKSTDRLAKSGANSKVMPLLGLAGEIGSLLTELKKEVREPAGTTDTTERVKEELGDILWYAVTIARRANLHFQRDVLFKNLERIKDDPSIYLPLLDGDHNPGKALRDAVERNDMRIVDTFKAYQDYAVKSARFASNREALVPYLTKIWKNSGDLLAKLKLEAADFSGREKPIVAQALGDVMWYVAGFATNYGLNFDDIAKENAAKALSMFIPIDQRKRTPLYDKDFPSLEQLPRQFDVIFAPAPWDYEQAIMIVNGMRVGDPLRDNAYKPEKQRKNDRNTKSKTEDDRSIEIDGYRFHDSVHFALVAILGWSPVLRGLMKRKRKTKGDVDDVDDGARAQIVEEMIVKLTHSYAVGIDKQRLLDDERHVSFDLLKQIKILASGLEVTGGRPGAKAAEYWEWEEAILNGYRVFNKLRRHRKGRLRVDLNQRAIEFSNLKEDEENYFPFEE